MSTIDLFAIGNALIDQEFKVTDEFLAQHNLLKGTMQLTDEPTQYALYHKLQSTQIYKGQASGGSAANTAVAYSALGGTAFYGCRVGSDELGHIYLTGLNDAGIHTTKKSISDGVTGTCMVLVSDDSERTMHTYLGITAELSAAQIDFEPLKTAKWLYIEGYLSTSETARAAVAQARQIAKQNNVKIAVSLSDPAMVQYARDGLNELIDDGVDLLFCNQDEAKMYTDTTSVEDARDALLKISNLVIITMSEKGALIANHQQSFIVSGRQVRAVDTNGAGDSFAGAFLYGVNHGMDLYSAANFAVLVSSEVVSQFGPRLENAYYAELLTQFKQASATDE